MTIEFSQELVLDVNNGRSQTMGEILYNYDEKERVFYPDCNWLTQKDLEDILNELKARNIKAANG